MAICKVKVKWGKETYEDVELNIEEPPIVFKAQLFDLTGVQPDRQRVMLKGATLKDEEWGNIKPKEGMMILMMGSRDENALKEPAEKVQFVEDMTESELNTALDLPTGLTNLGNTCYMNATIQCLKTVPELRDALKQFPGSLQLTGAGGVTPQTVTVALRDLYSNMDRSGEPIPPLVFVQMLHLAFPRFAEKGEGGGFTQQDANECWTELVRVLQQRLPPVSPPAVKGVNEASAAPHSSFIDQYFGGTLQVTMKCNEALDESETVTVENFLQLSCFISQDVKYMQSGLKSRMQETITKHSLTLGRDALYTKTSKISRLPSYLTVQFVRFFYKEKEAVNAKILKDIKFSMLLDVFELCTPELQQKLTPMRTKFKDFEDKKVEAAAKVDKSKAKGNLQNPVMGDKSKKTYPFSFEDDTGSNNSGYYELQAVLTHKGRSSSSGHYVGWIKRAGNQWIKCDDDVVSPVTEDDILKLSGGGDWHCAYVLLYGPRRLEIEEDENSSTAQSEVTSQTMEI